MRKSRKTRRRLDTLVARTDRTAGPTLAQIATTDKAPLARTPGKARYEQVQFHAHTYHRDSHHWRLNPADMGP